MRLVSKYGVWNMFRHGESVIITDERTLDNIIENPAKPLNDRDERGFSLEKKSLYSDTTSLMDICRRGKERKADEISVSYDFFFGGTVRENYPDSEKTLKAFKVIHDVAKEHGMGFSASILSPLDVGGGYARKYKDTGYTCQYQEGEIREDGSYLIPIVVQKRWLNNKGPVFLTIEKVSVYAFSEERIGSTSLFYVDPDKITDISASAEFEVDERSVKVSFNGYGCGNMKVFGKTDMGKEYNRCMAVVTYRTPELDYFSDDAIEYMKSIIDLHNINGISYTGFYSDEMHIQFDWDLFNHFGESEINTRYVSDELKKEYARRYGEDFVNFEKYMIYFSYHQHDFLEGSDGEEPSQHVFGKDESGIYETWLFRKRYFEMLARRVVDICNEAKDYAQKTFGNDILTKAHATWQESPTCDRFYKEARFSELQRGDISRYDYTPHYYWSSSIRENIAACYDYFKWNEFLTGGGTDHPEGGFADRNYYSQAFACSLGVLNTTPIAYNGIWGSPNEVVRRIRNVGAVYGNLTGRTEHNLVQGLSSRITDVLAIYPIDLNYIEERFGSWMVQYGYCNYITEDKLIEHIEGTASGVLQVKGRKYRALLVFFSPFICKETLGIIRDFVNNGGKVIWTSIYPISDFDGSLLNEWKEIFGIQSVMPVYLEITMKDKSVHFTNSLQGIEDMQVLTDMRPDFIYPVTPAQETEIVATTGEYVVGVKKEYPNGGCGIYLGFRPRDDQSCSTGQDISALSSILNRAGAYREGSLEMMSRSTNSNFLMNRFENGSVSVTNHYRTFYEEWDGKFFRDEKDKEFLAGRELPPAELHLEEITIDGHKISYEGTDCLTYRLDELGKLIRFAGINTTGIRVDNKDYVIGPVKSNILFTEVTEHLSEEIEKLYVVKVSAPYRVCLPLDIDEGYAGYVCNNFIFEASEGFDFEPGEGNIVIDITERLANRWLAIIKIKKGDK